MSNSGALQIEDSIWLAAEILDVDLESLTKETLDRVVFKHLQQLNQGIASKNETWLSEARSELEWACLELQRFLDSKTYTSDPVGETLSTSNLPELLVNSLWESAVLQPEQSGTKILSSTEDSSEPVVSLKKQSSVWTGAKGPKNPGRDIPNYPNTREIGAHRAASRELAPTRARVTFDDENILCIRKIVDEYQIPRGEMFRKIREFAGVDLTSLAKVLKISEGYLSDLEQDRLDSLPAIVYLRGFVVTYLRFFGIESLDPSTAYINYVQQYRSKNIIKK